MNKTAFQAVAERAFRALPEELLRHVDNVVFLVEDWPDAETLDSLEMDLPADLLGLYLGNPLIERGTEFFGCLPDQIVLYQKPIERQARLDRVPVVEVIIDTLLHEIGHHLGLDEDDLERLECGDPDGDRR